MLKQDAMMKAPEATMQMGDALMLGTVMGLVVIFATYIGAKIAIYWLSQKRKKKIFLKLASLEEKEKGNKIHVLTFDKHGNPKLVKITGEIEEKYIFL